MIFIAIFDMDGVIVDNGHYHFLAWQEFCQRHSLAFSEGQFKKQFFGKTNQQVLPELFGKNLSHKEIENYGAEKELIFCEIYRPVMQPMKGLVPFLKELKQNKVKMAVATSAPRGNVDLVLDGLSLNPFFDTVVNESMVTRSKPDPEIYLLAAKKLGVSPAECVVFEDSLAGTKAAFDAGCKVVALTSTLPASKHKYYHHLISDFTEISVNFISAELFKSKL